MEEKRIYKLRRWGAKIVGILFLVILSGKIGIEGYKITNQSKNINVKQQISEKDKKIEELKSELKEEKDKNIAGNFMNELMNSKYEGYYVGNSLSNDKFSFKLVFEENLNANIKIRCKYEKMGEDISIDKISYPKQNMKISEQNAKEGYLFLEGIDISTPVAYNDKDENLSQEDVKFSFLSDTELQTFNMKVWIKGNEMYGFIFNKEGKEIAKLTGIKVVDEKTKQ